MTRMIVDYYFTKPSNRVGEYETHDIVHKLKMDALPSDPNFGNNIDIFISKKEFPSNTPPSSNDLLFFTDKMKFYEAKTIDDGGDYYIIGVDIYK